MVSQQTHNTGAEPAQANSAAPQSNDRKRPPPHLLVAAQDVTDGVGAGQRLVDLHGRAAGVGKQRLHALALQGLQVASAFAVQVRQCAKWAAQARLGSPVWRGAA